jgi:PAS domain S-box-containing protein
MRTQKPRKPSRRTPGGAAGHAPQEPYRLLFEANPHPMWVYDLDTLAFLAVNDTAVRRYGYSREEFLGMTIKDIRPPEDIPALPENVARVGEGLDEAGIWRHQTKDGTLLEVEIVSHTLTFADRKAELVLAQDVTKRRQAEQTLRESERRLATLFRSSPDMVGIASLTEGRYLDVNDRYGRILGYSRDELIGRTIHELGIWADALPRATLVEALTRDGAVRNWEIQYRTKSGRVIVGLVSAELIDYAGAPCVLSVTRDVTERKQTEAALRESEAKLQSIFRATPAGVGVVVHRVLKAANQRLCEMVGYAEDELVNQSARLLYPTDEDFAYVGREKYAQIEATGVGTVETRWRRKDGTVLDVLLSSAPMEPDNWGAGVIFTALDITQRTRAEKALRENEERLRLALRAANQGLYDLNVQTGDAAVNEEYVRMLGYDPATFRETHAAWIERLHPDDSSDARRRTRPTLPEDFPSIRSSSASGPPRGNGCGSCQSGRSSSGIPMGCPFACWGRISISLSAVGPRRPCGSRSPGIAPSRT